MKRLLLLIFLLSGCRSLPSTPEIPQQSVLRGDPTGAPELPRLQSFDACILGDTMYVTATLQPTSPPLPSYAAWNFQAWVGTRWLDRSQMTSAEYVVTARELQDIGPLARVVRRTGSNGPPCEAWCDSVGVARVITLNGRRIELAIPIHAMGSTGTMACWMQFTNGDLFDGLWWALATRKGFANPERI